MARRATAIKQEREQNKGILLVLDAGSSLMGTQVALQSEGRVIVEAMNVMGYDALAIGRMDLAAGLDKTLERAREAEFAFLSANLVTSSDNKPVFQPYIVLERGGARIGIVGLSEPQAGQAPGMGKVATVLDATDAARRYIAELREQVELLVVLSHLGLEEDKALAGVLPGIDIIIGGNTRKLMQEPERVGNTLIVQQGYRGEWLGRLEATFDAQGVPQGSRVDILTLDDKFGDDPDIVAQLTKWRELYPSPTPMPTWTHDPRTPSATPWVTAAPIRTVVAPTRATK